jgi:electron transfer flavoprotein-quinone oxidoreductase
MTLLEPDRSFIGDAASFILNTGLTIRGMDLAAGSAIAAAQAILSAPENNPSMPANKLRGRYCGLAESFAGGGVQLGTLCGNHGMEPALGENLGDRKLRSSR